MTPHNLHKRIHDARCEAERLKHERFWATVDGRWKDVAFLDVALRDAERELLALQVQEGGGNAGGGDGN